MDAPTITIPPIYAVDPDRLALGQWSHDFNQTVGEGDIAASYSADLLAMEGRVRCPFVYHGELWVTTSRTNGNAEAYRLTPLDDFQAEAQAVTFGDRFHDCAAARKDPQGFYHSVSVQYRKDWFVLDGPPSLFMPGDVVQPSLFGGG